MTDITGGMIGGGIAGAASIGSSLIGASASKSAAKAQERAAIDAQQWEEAVYNQSRADMAPWLSHGQGALNDLVSMLHKGPGKFEESPGYQFRLGEGVKTVERGAAARGNLLGGATQKGLTQFGQNYASNEYDKWLNNWYKSLTPYQSLAGVGQTSAQQTGQMGMQAGGGIANSIMAGGEARAAGTLGQANTWGNALNWGANQVGNALMYNQGGYGGYGGYGQLQPWAKQAGVTGPIYDNW